MSYYPIQHMVSPIIDLRHYDSPAVRSQHLLATFVATYGRDSTRSYFSPGQCLATHKKGVTGLLPQNDFPSLAYLIAKFVTISAYLPSLWTRRWRTNKFGRIRGLFRSTAKADTVEHQKGLVCLIPSPYSIVQIR